MEKAVTPDCFSKFASANVADLARQEKNAKEIMQMIKIHITEINTWTYLGANLYIDMTLEPHFAAILKYVIYTICPYLLNV